MLGIILIVAGAITLAAGVALVATPEKQQADNQSFDAATPDTGVVAGQTSAGTTMTNEPAKAPSQPKSQPQAPEAKPEPVATPQNTTSFDENKRKGDAFEKYVVKHFDPKFFNVMEWRGDKYVDGRYAVSSHFPDLEIEFFFKKRDVTERFAVECKWRNDYFKGGVQWAENYNIRNYQEFAREVKIPVFVVIGIGGTPDQPSDIYVLPLKKATTPFLTTTELAPFKRRDPKADFFYDYENDWLN